MTTTADAPAARQEAADAALTGMVFDVQRYSTHDGPGTRTTVFLKGCYLRCAWCHNPESMSTRPEVMFDAAQCIGCLACYEACEVNALYLTDAEGQPIARADVAGYRERLDEVTDRVHESARCVRCGACAEACWPGALQLVGRERTLEQVLAEVRADAPFYAGSGGGVTVSGGEPLFQHRFVAALLAACRREGLHTALDTTAFGHWAPLADVLEHTCLVLLDLKVMDPEKHRVYTGVANDSILRNARALGAHMAAAGGAVWIRIPVIPGVNDDEDNLRATADFARAQMSGAVEVVELLGYHGLGASKLERLGRDGADLDTAPLSREALATRAGWVADELEGSRIQVRSR